MNCHFCNKEIPGGVNFCPECGNNLTEFNARAEAQAQQNSYAAQENGYNTAPQNGYTQYNQQYTYNQAPYTAPMQTEDKKNGKNGLAIASFVLALTSFVTCGFTSILGFIFGLIGLKSNRKGFAIAGIVISAVFIATFILGFIAGIADNTFVEDFYYEFDDFYQYY